MKKAYQEACLDNEKIVCKQHFDFYYYTQIEKLEIHPDYERK